MKSLKNFINEGFKLGKNKVSKTTERKYFPKNIDELREILYERLEEDKNADLNDIDVSKIDNMSNLFKRFDPHDIDISEWDVSNVKNMNEIFRDCKNFKGEGLENWNVRNVRQMVMSFEGCKNLNCDLSYWDVSSVQDMRSMFRECASFEGIGLENWDVSNVKYMTNMFRKCNSMKTIPSWYKE